MAKYEDFKKSQESRLLLTTALQTTTFSYWDTVPSLYILRLNKYLKISNSWIGFGSNSMIANYSIRSEILNISHSTKQDTCQMRPEVAELLLSESENPEWCVHVFVSLCVGVSVCVCTCVCLSVCLSVSLVRWWWRWLFWRRWFVLSTWRNPSSSRGKAWTGAAYEGLWGSAGITCFVNISIGFC